MRRFIESLTRDGKLKPHLVYRGLAPGLDPVLAEPATGWPQGSREACRALGVTQLYRHQSAALDAIANGDNVLLATPTASGKTLAYLLSFLARRRVDPEARAVFVYPLKALARDQLTTIRRFLAPLGLSDSQAAEVYDGDTPDLLRRKIRKNPPAVLVTNPDMLHLGIIPSHETWGPFLARLSLIVIDEAHVYRGIFGAHVHHVLRRLLRLARHHGGSPRVLAGSATIGEPKAFIETLVGEPFTLIHESGAPAAPRHVLFFAPAAVSPYTVAVQLLAKAVAAGHKSIAFTKARRITELMHQWLRRTHPHLIHRIATYRSGYLPEERREIERRLFSEELGGVISTSALEAGIDVGGLDVAILVGYPGSLATAWQRIGRAGRQDRDSLAILVALPDALDQYVVRHPEHFFSGEFERVVLDPCNDTVADAHLVAAGAERSLDLDDLLDLQGALGPERAARLCAAGKLVEAADAESRWFSLRRRPQQEIYLRSIGSAFELKRTGDGRSLGTLDQGRAWFEGHPGAIYLHAGQSFRSLDLDEEKRTITLEPAEVEYFTQVYARKETEILERAMERPLIPGVHLVWGRVKVTTFIEGYSRRRLFTQEEISRHELQAPPQVLETISTWIEFPRELPAWLVAEEFHPAGALHAVEHASIGLFPLLAICDRWDLGGISYAHHPQLDRPAVFIYDGWPGGVGLARTGYERAEDLFGQTAALLAACPCEDGCPACIHSPKCGSGNQPLDKAGALAVLEFIVGRRKFEGTGAPVEEVEARLARHRQGIHRGVRGTGPLPAGFFAEDVSASAPVAELLESPAGPAAAGRPVILADIGWEWDFPQPGQLLAPDEGRWLFWDVETLRSAEDVGGWDNIRDMGMALAVTLDGRTGEFRTWTEAEALDLIEELIRADRVVGFNQDRFDLTVLSRYVGARVKTVRSLDLLKEIHNRFQRRFSLGHLAEETLGAGKTADGLQSLQWIREGRIDLVERYCREDVRLTAALWAHGRDKGHLVFRSKDGRRGKIPVSW